MSDYKTLRMTLGPEEWDSILASNVEKYAEGQPRNAHGQFTFSHTPEGRPYELQPTPNAYSADGDYDIRRNEKDSYGNLYGMYGPQSQILATANFEYGFDIKGKGEFAVAQELAYNAIGKPPQAVYSGEDRNALFREIIADPNYPKIPQEWMDRAKTDNEAKWGGQYNKDPNEQSKDALDIWRNADPTSYDAYAKSENDFVMSKLKAYKLEGGQSVGEVMDAIKSDVVGQLGDMARTLDASVSLNKSKLGHFIDEDHYKTVFEVGKVYGKGAGGQEYFDRRTNTENAIGVPQGTAAANRPVYGVIGNLGSPYGDSSIILKPETKVRSTITWGDSIDNQSGGGAIWANEYANGTVSDADFWRANGWKIKGILGSSDNSHNTGEVTSRPRKDRIHNFSYIAGGGRPFDINNNDSYPVIVKYNRINVKSHLGLFTNYVETQIHGGIGLKDVAHVIIPSETALTGKQKQILTDNGITYEVSTEVKDAYDRYH